MLESRASFFIASLSIALCVILSFITIPLYTAAEYGNSACSLQPGRFILTLIINFLISSVFYLILKLPSKSLSILKDKIIIAPYIGKPKVKLLSEITSITWGSPIENRQLWLRSVNYFTPVREDFVVITFVGGEELKIGVRDYVNFDELRGWFLTYGRKTGLIKVKPLSERKRRRR